MKSAIVVLFIVVLMTSVFFKTSAPGSAARFLAGFIIFAIFLILGAGFTAYQFWKRKKIVDPENKEEASVHLMQKR